jgi:hypothetical protein
MATIEAMYLEGLTFSGAKAVKVKKDGQEKTENQRFTRPLTAADVLSFTETADGVVIVTKDGQKYRVPKGPGARPNVKETIAKVMSIKDIDELKQLKKSEDRKGVLEAIDAQIESLKK